MIKTTLKIDGMMCGMCEAHMNELIRSNFKVKKVSSSAKDGETVIISEDALDIPWAKNKIKEIGYELGLLREQSHMRRKDFSTLEESNLYVSTSGITIFSIAWRSFLCSITK